MFNIDFEKLIMMNNKKYVKFLIVFIFKII